MNKEVQHWLKQRGLEKDERIAELLALMSTWPVLSLSVKWNAPNYSLNGNDRITFQVPPHRKVVNLILHCGASSAGADLRGRIADPQGLLQWRSPDRAILSFATAEAIREQLPELRLLLNQWLRA
jgi:hypothetical protein